MDDRLHTIVGLSGTTVRLLDEAGSASLVLLSHLLVSEGFELIGHGADQSRMPPFALLDIVPEREAEKAVAWERHVTEVEFGKPLDADLTALPRPEYDPARHTVEERVAAKAAELRAIGWQASVGTVQRMRRRYREQGLWGLVDHRATRLSSPTGRADDRVVAAITEILAATTNESTGTRGRLRRRVEALLAERHGPGTVAMPSKSAFYRLVEAMSEGMHAFGEATAAVPAIEDGKRTHHRGTAGARPHRLHEVVRRRTTIVPTGPQQPVNSRFERGFLSELTHRCRFSRLALLDMAAGQDRVVMPGTPRAH